MEEKGWGYKNWIDNVNYASPKKNGQFYVQILSDNNILKTLYTKDKNASFDMNEIETNNLSIRICHKNELYGNGDWAEITI